MHQTSYHSTLPQSLTVFKITHACAGFDGAGVGDPDIGYDYDDLEAAMGEQNDSGDDGAGSDDGADDDYDDDEGSEDGSEGGSEDGDEGGSGSDEEGDSGSGSEGGGASFDFDSQDEGSESSEGEWEMLPAAGGAAAGAKAAAKAGAKGAAKRDDAKGKKRKAAGSDGDEDSLEGVNINELPSPTSSDDFGGGYAPGATDGRKRHKAAEAAAAGKGSKAAAGAKSEKAPKEGKESKKKAKKDKPQKCKAGGDDDAPSGSGDGGDDDFDAAMFGSDDEEELRKLLMGEGSGCAPRYACQSLCHRQVYQH